MTRLTTLLALLVVCCLGRAHAGPLYGLSVRGNINSVMNIDGNEVRYNKPYSEDSSNGTLSYQDSAPSLIQGYTNYANAGYGVNATPGALHASASANTALVYSSPGGTYSEASAGVTVGSFDELYFSPTEDSTASGSPNPAVRYDDLVIVGWSIDGNQQLSGYADRAEGSNLMSYVVQLGTSSDPESNSVVSSNIFYTAIAKTVSNQGGVQGTFDNFDSCTDSGSIRLSQSLFVGVSLDDVSALYCSGQSDFSNTAKIVGVGLLDKNGNLISPSDYTLSSASGYNYPLLGSPPAATPEPASLTLLGLGGLALAAYGWRRRKGVSLA